jgi:hypothetical protein
LTEHQCTAFVALAGVMLIAACLGWLRASLLKRENRRLKKSLGKCLESAA